MSSWTSFIEHAPAANHAVQVYDEDSELTDSVAAYLAGGLSVGTPAVVIATNEHRLQLAGALEAHGLDVAGLEEQGLLTFADAGETLAAIMEGELPSREQFERVVGDRINRLAARYPGQTVRAFGEMVDLLWQRGQEGAAIALEELWNELAKSHRFALLCGYHLDIFDLDVQTAALPAIFDAHSHARAAAEPSRLAAAVDQALAEVVGPMGAARIYLAVAEHVPPGSQRSQAVLSWLSTSEVPAADKILRRARSHYVRSRVAPTEGLAAPSSAAA